MAGSSAFGRLAEVAKAVSATRSKLAKRDLLAAYLRDLVDDDLATAAALFSGRPLADPTAKLGLGWVQQSAALTAASGADEDALRAAYLRHSDFGDAAAELLTGVEPVAPPLTIADVAAAFARMAASGAAQ